MTVTRRVSLSHRRENAGGAMVLVLLLVSGCEGSPLNSTDPLVAIDTIDGIIRVKNGEVGVWGEGEQWEVRQDWRIGAVDGPAETLFRGGWMSVSRSPIGQLYVLDLQGGDVSVFDGTGRFLRRFAGNGEGPGELSRPNGMGWDTSGRLWIGTAFNGRYTVFDSLGALVKTVPRQMRITIRLQHPLVFDKDGRFVDEGAFDMSVRLLRVDTTGLVLDTLTPLSLPALPTSVASAFVRPGGDFQKILRYLPRLKWAYSPDGTVWLVESGELRLYQRTLEGDTVRIVETRHRSGALTEDEELMVERGLREVGLREHRDSFLKPLVQSIHVMPDGHILVQITDVVHQGSGEFDVFDPEGRYLGSVQMGFAMSWMGYPALFGDTIVAMATGDLDVPYLVRATIYRPGH